MVEGKPIKMNKLKSIFPENNKSQYLYVKIITFIGHLNMQTKDQ